MESVVVLRRGLRSLLNSKQGIQTLYGHLGRIQTDFYSDNLSSHGPPKVVFQSLSSYV